jgi:ATP-binding cassette subfamily B multidrug efflux pump
VSREEKATAQSGMDEQTGQRFVYQDDEILDKEFDWGQVKRLGKYLKPYAKQILPIIITMMFVGALTKLLNPLLIAYAIDNALRDGGGDSKLLFQCVSGMLLLYIIQWAANSYRIRYTNQIGQKVIYDLRHDLFSHIQKLSFRFFDKRPAGSILVRITNYVNSLQDLFANGVVNLLMDCVQLLGIIFILLT